MAKTIYDILLKDGARVSFDNKRLVWNSDNMKWTVYKARCRTKTLTILYQGHDEEKAVETILGE